MTWTNGQPEAAKSSATIERRDPLEFARTLVEQFSDLSADFASSQEFRDRLYAYLQGILAWLHACPVDAYTPQG